ncbi:MAG TPA: chemotaxis protein CheX [Phycisphaerae bacterium]|nr:chemotaxis protein CheX [Phycisphaerae bacterium]HRY69420.1 chemotaxis protein CheX [Phycisphaerae bacterium]HSA26287.1 chemotaxis protein CheX [Phycisphaerae bacterium]
MDARYINPFVASAKNVFKTMLAADVVIGKPFVIPSSKEPDADVSALIGLSGDAVGCVVLTFPMATAVMVAGRFAGVALDSMHPDFCDALGELANMVAGHAKAQMVDLDVSISLPSVVVGAHHIVSQSKQSPRLALPCCSDLGRFHVEVAMEVESKAGSLRSPVAAGAGA